MSRCDIRCLGHENCAHDRECPMCEADCHEDYDRKIAAARILLDSNVACGCCDGDEGYVLRAIEVIEALGLSPTELREAKIEIGDDVKRWCRDWFEENGLL